MHSFRDKIGRASSWLFGLFQLFHEMRSDYFVISWLRVQTALLTFHQLTRLGSITRYKTAMFISLADSNWKQPLYPQFSNFHLNYPKTKQQISYLIASPLCAIFNQSIISGVLPDEWKLSKVVLCWNNLNNYRPISIVPAVTKVFERIINDQFYSYLTENIILFRVENQV